jgi:thiamine monophosphate synthase
MKRYCITDSLDVAVRAAGDAVEMIQIRAKQLSARDLMDLVRGAVAIPGARVLVNTRTDVALACGARSPFAGGFDRAQHHSANRADGFSDWCVVPHC